MPSDTGAIGQPATGDIGQIGGVDVSNLTINSVEEVLVNGTEVIINFAQLAPGGFQIFTGKNGALDMLTIGNVSSGNFSTLALNAWEAQDQVSLLGTVGIDNITGTGGADNFLGYGGQDNFSGGNGNDRFLILPGDTNPIDRFYGDAGTDVLQLDGQAVVNFDVGIKTDIRSMSLSSIETLDVVKGEFIVDAYMLAGTYYGTTASNTLAFRPSSFRRVSPDRWATPHARTTVLDPLRSI